MSALRYYARQFARELEAVADNGSLQYRHSSLRAWTHPTARPDI